MQVKNFELTGEAHDKHMNIKDEEENTLRKEEITHEKLKFEGKAKKKK